MQASTKYDAASIPVKCQRSIISLDGNKIEFTTNSGVIANNLLVLTDNQHADVSAKQLGDFGAGDFTVELTYTGEGSDSTPDGDSGILFRRSAQFQHPYTGPYAALFDNGRIRFRLVVWTLGACEISVFFVSHHRMTTPKLNPLPCQLGYLLLFFPRITGMMS